MIDALTVGQLYSNEEIFKALKVSNAGGIRLSLQRKYVQPAIIMTSVQRFHGSGENPYHDRLEGGILTYTAAGKVGEQTLSGVNRRVIEQREFPFPIHGFTSVANRRNKLVGPKHWEYLGLLKYRRHYPDNQLDSHGKIRKVWIFEFEIHRDPQTVPLALDATISKDVLGKSRLATVNLDDADTIVIGSDDPNSEEMEGIEQVRGKLLAMEPRRFEF